MITGPWRFHRSRIRRRVHDGPCENTTRARLINSDGPSARYLLFDERYECALREKLETLYFLVGTNIRLKLRLLLETRLERGLRIRSWGEGGEFFNGIDRDYKYNVAGEI